MKKVYLSTSKNCNQKTLRKFKSLLQNNGIPFYQWSNNGQYSLNVIDDAAMIICIPPRGEFDPDKEDIESGDRITVGKGIQAEAEYALKKYKSALVVHETDLDCYRIFKSDLEDESDWQHGGSFIIDDDIISIVSIKDALGNKGNLLSTSKTSSNTLLLYKK